MDSEMRTISQACCQCVIVIHIAVTLFGGFIKDAKEPTASDRVFGNVSTIIVVICMFSVFYGAGSFSLLF